MTTNTDFLIIGGGIVGMATALKLSEKHPNRTITVLEKETELAAHQTGRNSGVIHAGVYYQPGSLKAEFCHKGVEATVAFCSKHQVAFEQVGKLIVATNDEELPRMEALYERSKTNGLNPVRVSVEELREREPNVAGVGALFYETSGIADYAAMTRKMAALVEQNGGKVILDTEVTGITEHADHVIVETSNGQFIADHLTVCGGLQADRLAKMARIDIDFQIIPFRGEYYQLGRHLDNVVKHLIYPVPNPALPFLGVHLTPMIGGEVTIGPNAVLGMAREGYAKGSVNIKDLVQMIGFSGFWLSIFQNLKSGIREMRNSLSKRYYLSLCQKYCPSLTLDDLEPYRTGIRAMAVLSDGSLYHDFLVKQTPRMLHVCNAPSPAATSSLPIGDYVVELISKAEQAD